MSTAKISTPNEVGEITGNCESYWKTGMPCPNAAEWIVKETDRRGSMTFAIMCEPHKDGYLNDHNPAAECLPFTREVAEELNLAVKQEMEAKA